MIRRIQKESNAEVRIVEEEVHIRGPRPNVRKAENLIHEILKQGIPDAAMGRTPLQLDALNTITKSIGFFYVDNTIHGKPVPVRLEPIPDALCKNIVLGHNQPFRQNDFSILLFEDLGIVVNQDSVIGSPLAYWSKLRGELERKHASAGKNTGYFIVLGKYLFQGCTPTHNCPNKTTGKMRGQFGCAMNESHLDRAREILLTNGFTFSHRFSEDIYYCQNTHTRESFRIEIPIVADLYPPVGSSHEYRLVREIKRLSNSHTLKPGPRCDLRLAMYREMTIDMDMSITYEGEIKAMNDFVRSISGNDNELVSDIRIRLIRRRLGVEVYERGSLLVNLDRVRYGRGKRMQYSVSFLSKPLEGMRRGEIEFMSEEEIMKEIRNMHKEANHLSNVLTLTETP